MLNFIQIQLFALLPHLLVAYRVSHVSECGISRGCWLLPPGCKSAADCTTLITWKHIGRSLQVEIETETDPDLQDQYIAWGISKDSQMGNDTVFDCHFTNSQRNAVHLSHNIHKNNLILEGATSMLLKDSYAEVQEGRLFCGGEWMLDNTLIDDGERNQMHHIRSGKYTLLFVHGELNENGKKSMHSLSGRNAPWISNEQVRFCEKCSKANPHIDLFVAKTS